MCPVLFIQNILNNSREIFKLLVSCLRVPCQSFWKYLDIFLYFMVFFIILLWYNKTTALFSLQGFYRCMGKSYHNYCHSNVLPDTVSYSPHYGNHVVHRGTSLQIPVYCCLTTKRTSPLRQGQTLRSSDHSNPNSKCTDLTKKR